MEDNAPSSLKRPGIGEPLEANPFSNTKNKNIPLRVCFYSSWLGMRDSNPRMVGPEPTALPLGESPTVLFILVQLPEKSKAPSASNDEGERC